MHYSITVQFVGADGWESLRASFCPRLLRNLTCQDSQSTRQQVKTNQSEQLYIFLAAPLEHPAPHRSRSPPSHFRVHMLWDGWGVLVAESRDIPVCSAHDGGYTSEAFFPPAPARDRRTPAPRPGSSRAAGLRTKDRQSLSFTPPISIHNRLTPMSRCHSTPLCRGVFAAPALPPRNSSLRHRRRAV